MKKLLIVTLALVITSCAGILSKKDAFVGDWVISESSPYYNDDDKNRVKIRIVKEDIFYKVSFTQDGRDFYDIFYDSKNKTNKEALNYYEQLHKYQLSPDKRFLFNIVDPTGSFGTLIFNEDNNTIQCGLGWFKKE